MNRASLGLVALLSVFLPLAARAQLTEPESIRTVADSAAGAPIVLQADTIAILRATIRGIEPARRAQIAEDRLEALNSNQMLEPVRIEPLDEGYALLVGDVFVFGFVKSDVVGGQTALEAAEQARPKLQHVLSTRAKLMKPGQRLRSSLLAIVSTVLLILGLLLLGRLRRFFLGWIEKKTKPYRGKLRLGDLDFLAQFALLAAWLAKILIQLSVLAAILVWLIFVLNRFPETQPLGMAARSAVLTTLNQFRRAFFEAVPDLIAVVLIFVITRFVTRLARDFFTGIEHGTITVHGIHPETAGATRRLVNVLIWLLAIVVAYPFVPGSNSDAFKGLSVFIGLVVSLGSSGIVGHMMSGLVLVYSRALRPGDVVRIGEIEGKVTEVGALSVKVATARGEEFTIPNQVIVGTTVKNYSRLARESSSVLSTTVTIGYSAPWRVVSEMLLAAAERTSGIRKEPIPEVLQLSLTTFAVEYQLVLRLEPSANRLAVLTHLHQNIQDVFNERGVQIMVPAYESQPEKPILVPKEMWSKAPADAKGA